MKNRIWLFQLPLIALFAFAFWVHESGVVGKLGNGILRQKVFPHVERISNLALDLKFRLRGLQPQYFDTSQKNPENPALPLFKNPNKIVIVEVDSASIDELGRWPWPRETIAAIINTVAGHGAKAIGLDITFSEPTFPVDPRFLCDIRTQKVDRRNLLDWATYQSIEEISAVDYGYDAELAAAIQGRKVALGWMTEGLFSPAAQPEYTDQLIDPDRRRFLDNIDESESYAIQSHLQNKGCAELSRSVSRTEILREKFSMKPVIRGQQFSDSKPFNQLTTPIITGTLPVANLSILSIQADGSGLLDTLQDSDGTIRRAPLIRVFDDQLYPSLPLEMVRMADYHPLAILNSNGEVLGLELHTVSDPKSTPIAVNRSGLAQINFRGGRRTFRYRSAKDLYNWGFDEVLARRKATKIRSEYLKKTGKLLHIEIEHHQRDPELESVFKDAYVLIGVTAAGVFDLRTFPTDANVPGTEGWATILDNILSNDFLTSGSLGHHKSTQLIYITLLIGALSFALLLERLESLSGLIITVLIFSTFVFTDIKLLFKNNVQWNTSLIYLEFGLIFIITNAIKYVLEERNKKFIKGAFSKYVSPAIVDSIIKDPTKLTVGGERRELSILFSDIRGFTTFSERMDPKALASFLNDYLGIMTDVVFDTEGTLDKYIGDAVMAFWGAPLDQPKHAANACRAAQIMLQKLAEHRERFKTQYGVEVNIGIGINSGLVNVGNMGSERIFEYTVIGDHVNLASRLEGLTKYYGAGIVTTRFTFDMIQKGGEPLPAHRTLDSVKVKGKKDAVELIQVLERNYDTDGLRLFEEARQLYLKQDWDGAITKFKEANSKLTFEGQEDGPSNMYLERCAELKTTGVEPDWDGAWKMTSK